MTPLPPSIFHFFILLTTLTTAEALIRNLSGAASFRSAVIRWENQREKSSGPAEAASEPIFAISICETQPWGPRECRETITDAKRLHKTQDDGIGGRHEAFAYELKGYNAGLLCVFALRPFMRKPFKMSFYTFNAIRKKVSYLRAFSCNTISWHLHSPH